MASCPFMGMKLNLSTAPKVPMRMQLSLIGNLACSVVWDKILKKHIYIDLAI